MGQSVPSCCDFCAQPADKELVLDGLREDGLSVGSDPGVEDPVAAWGSQEEQAEPSPASSPCAGRSHDLGAACGREQFVGGCSWHTPAVVLRGGGTGSEEQPAPERVTSTSSQSYWAARTPEFAAPRKWACGGPRCPYRSQGGVAWGTVVLTGTVGSYAAPALLGARGFTGPPCLASPDDPAARSPLWTALSLHVAGAAMAVSGAAAAWILKSANSDHLWHAAKVAFTAWVVGLVNFGWYVALCSEGKYETTLMKTIGSAFFFTGLLLYVSSMNLVTARLRPIISVMKTRCSLAISLLWSAQWLAPASVVLIWLLPMLITFLVGVDVLLPTIAASGAIVAAHTIWACLPLLIGIRRARWLAEHSDGKLAKEGRWALWSLRVQLLGLVLVQGSSVVHMASLATEYAVGYRFGVAVTSLDIVLNTVGVLVFSGAFTGAVRGEARMRQRATAAVGRRRRLSEPAREPDERWDATVEALAGRGITLRALLRLFAGLGRDFMFHYDPTRHTTADVVRQAIIPLSHTRQCALVEVVMRGRAVRPATMVTHTWGSLFVHLVAGICAHALDLVEYSHLVPILLRRDLDNLEEALLGAGTLDATYWVCALSVNQHTVMCGSNPHGDRDPVTHLVHPVCDCGCRKCTNTTAPVNADGKSIFSEVNKFSDMMRLLAYGNNRFEQLILVDERFRLFTRAWCMAEIATAHDIGMFQCMTVLSAEAFNRHRWGFTGFQIENMAATRPEDKEDILREIGDTEAFNCHVSELLFKDLFQNWLEFDSMSQVMRITSMLRVQRMLQSSGASAGRTLTVDGA